MDTQQLKVRIDVNYLKKCFWICSFPHMLVHGCHGGTLPVRSAFAALEVK